MAIGIDIHDPFDLVAHTERAEESNAFRAGAPNHGALSGAADFVEPRAPHTRCLLEALLENGNIPGGISKIVLGVELRPSGASTGRASMSKY